MLSAAAATSSGEEDVAGDVSVYAIVNGTVSIMWRWWLRSIKQKGEKRTPTVRRDLFTYRTVVQLEKEKGVEGCVSEERDVVVDVQGERKD